MMSILTKIQEAINASREAIGFTISESNPGDLFIRGRMSRAILSAWQTVFDEQCHWLVHLCRDESDDEIQPSSGQENEIYRFTIQFTSPEITPHFFTPEGWRSFLLNEAILYKAVTVKLAFIENGFETKAFNVEPWLNAPVSVEVQEQKKSSSNTPRKIVRCQASDLMAPIRIEPWILANSIPEQSAALTIWQEIAAQMIAKSLPNELYKDENTPKVSLSGQPPRRIELGNFQTNNSLFQTLQEAASWIYLEGEDVEVRHTFLSAELARAWIPEISFCDGLVSRLESALESARLVYKAHLRSGSKDTLKALADLRKTLNDDVQKLLQQSKDLSGAVWRDVAIAIGVLAVRFAVDSVKANSLTIGFAAIYFLVATYISISYLITIATNNRFLGIIETSRESWRTHLYGFLDEKDYKELADNPLQAASKAYRCTQARTTVVVLFVVFILLLGIAVEMQWINLEIVIKSLEKFMNFINYLLS